MRLVDSGVEVMEHNEATLLGLAVIVHGGSRELKDGNQCFRRKRLADGVCIEKVLF